MLSNQSQAGKEQGVLEKVLHSHPFPRLLLCPWMGLHCVEERKVAEAALGVGQGLVWGREKPLNMISRQGGETVIPGLGKLGAITH